MPQFYNPNVPGGIETRKSNVMDRVVPTKTYVVTLIFHQPKRIRVRTFGPFSNYGSAARVRDRIKARIEEDESWGVSRTTRTVHTNELWSDSGKVNPESIRYIGETE